MSQAGNGLLSSPPVPQGHLEDGPTAAFLAVWRKLHAPGEHGTAPPHDARMLLRGFGRKRISVHTAMQESVYPRVSTRARP